MEKRTLDILEYDKIVQQLTELSFSELGRELCANLKPLTNAESIEQLQEATASGVQIILKKGIPPLRGLYNLRPALARSQSGSSMSCGQLLRVTNFLQAIKVLHGFAISEVDLPQNYYNNLLRNLVPLDALHKRLSQAIIGEDELSDNASPNLARIRQQIRFAQEKVKQILQKLMKANADYLQEQLITMRGNRYVLPVQDVHRGQISGIVHDTSGSGHTIFVEPLAVVEANNKIRELEAAERDEIMKILQDLTALIVAESDNLIINQGLAAEIDFVTAKARLALAMDAQPPRLNSSGYISLLNARHPLLPKDKAVPITLKLGGGVRTLLITGPNTGGKTVALKTCGLLTLMAQSGLHIPASEQSEVYVCRKIMVDIGDAQSIEQNLSTFSSHMSRLIAMTEQADAQSLILSDEMGSGTDPLEGAALARAILHTWQAKGAITMATTHYRELKLYALTTAGVENACCELEPLTLKPTYRILLGAVGVSQAFPISESLGLNPEIIALAKSYITSQDKELEVVMQELNASKTKAEMALRQAEQDSLIAEKARQEAEHLRQKLQNQQQSIRSKEREAAREKYREGLARIDELLKELKDYKLNHLNPEFMGKIAENRRNIGGDYNKIQAEIGVETLKALHNSGENEQVELVVGAWYFATSLGLNGRLLTLPDNKDQCKLDTGMLTVKVASKTLAKAKDIGNQVKSGLADKSEFYRQQKRRQLGSGSEKMSKANNSNLPLELLLLGETTLDAVERLDKHIDSSIMVGIHEVRIVHGKGTGALRQAVQNFLRKDKRVKEFRLAGYGEGDSGVTIATLK